jgi:tetratricopeptide (TPR) repeat protein
MTNYDLPKLRKHTFELVHRYPTSTAICFYNVIAFYRSPAYRMEVIDALEKQLARGKRGHEAYWVLAQVCEGGAKPHTFRNEVERQSFLRYYRLPANTALSDKWDVPLASKAEKYYRLAIQLAGNNQDAGPLYSFPFALMLSAEGKQQQAIQVCEKALSITGPTMKPRLLITYGKCLRAAKQHAKAISALSKVRTIDHKGQNKGASEDTVEAELLMGMVALDMGDRAEAGRHLMASTNVDGPQYGRFLQFELALPQRLLKLGEKAVVRQFCDVVLRKFQTDEKEIMQLRSQALP